MHGKKRLFLAAGTLASVGAIVALGVGLTFGLFSSTATSQSNSFTAGTVTLTRTANAACSYGNLAPGDSITPCTMTATYGGSLDAYVGLDVTIVTVPACLSSCSGTGNDALYNPGSSTPPGPGLTLTITDNDTVNNSYTVPATPVSCSGISATTGAVCYQAVNELSAHDTNSTTYAGGGTDATTWTVTPLFTTANGNPYQGSSAAVTLTAHAVQKAHQTDSGTIGQTDATISWS